MEIDEPEGLTIISTLKGCQCDISLLLNHISGEEFLKQAVLESGLTPVHSGFFSFSKDQYDQYGNSGCVQLAESHVSWHTWPEELRVNVQIFTCNYSQNNDEKARKLFALIRDYFKPTKIRYQEVIEKDQ